MGAGLVGGGGDFGVEVGLVAEDLEELAVLALGLVACMVLKLVIDSELWSL
jgi:hypothetical protein